jgi:hypothetical protein
VHEIIREGGGPRHDEFVLDEAPGRGGAVGESAKTGGFVAIEVEV